MPDSPGPAVRATDRVRSFNLLPWRERQQRENRRRALAMLALGVAAAAALLTAIELPARGQLRLAGQQIAQLEGAIAAERRAAADHKTLEERKSSIASLTAEIQRIRRANSVVLDWLEALPAQIPGSLRVTGLTAGNRRWELRGVTDEWRDTAELLRRVREMPMAVDVRMDQLQSNPDASQQFLLVGSFAE